MSNLSDKIRDVAEYDGWVKYKGFWIAPEGFNLPCANINEPLYYTNIEWLYPVAKRVCEELKPYGYDTSDKILMANNSFDIPALFDAVYQGIVLIEKFKK